MGPEVLAALALALAAIYFVWKIVVSGVKLFLKLALVLLVLALAAGGWLGVTAQRAEQREARKAVKLLERVKEKGR